MSVYERALLSLLFDGGLDDVSLRGGTLCRFEERLNNDAFFECLVGSESDWHVCSSRLTKVRIPVLKQELLVERGARLPAQDVLDILLGDVDLLVKRLGAVVDQEPSLVTQVGFSDPEVLFAGLFS